MTLTSAHQSILSLLEPLRVCPSGQLALLCRLVRHALRARSAHHIPSEDFEVM